MQPLEQYRLSEKTGAVLEQPAHTLPNAYEVWNQLASEFTKLSQTNRLRDHIQAMPIISTETPMTYEELRLAHKILAFAASAYIWMNGENDVPDCLPAQIAVPLVALSAKLGLPPILTHQDLVLANCVRLQTAKPPELIHQPTHHRSWKAFIELSGNVEILFAPALTFLCDAIRAQHPLDEMRIAFCLGAIRHTLERMTDSLNLFHEQLDADEFYLDLRPILCGWTRNPIQNGLVYEGVTKATFEGKENSAHCLKAIELREGTSQSASVVCIGASAAQSICLQSLDALLQVDHKPENQAFFQTMRRCMIPEHQEFLRDLENHSQIKKLAENARLSELKFAYNDCLRAVNIFREKHMTLVHRFIEKPAIRQVAKLHSLESTGTGGQKLQQFLQSVRDSGNPLT